MYNVTTQSSYLIEANTSCTCTIIVPALVVRRSVSGEFGRVEALGREDEVLIKLTRNSTMILLDRGRGPLAGDRVWLGIGEFLVMLDPASCSRQGDRVCI